MSTQKGFQRWFRNAIGALISTAMVFGCSGSQEEPDNLFFDEWKARVPESQAYNPAPAASQQREIISPEALQRRIEAEQELEPSAKPLPKRKITMIMNDIDVAVLLRALSRAANQNIILNEKVTGKVNINIKNAPWDQVFKGILLTNGLTYTWEGDIIRIMTVEDLETELLRESQRKELENVAPLVTRIVKVSYANASKMRANLENFISQGREGSPLGSVTVDEHTNSLIIQAVPNDMRRMLAVVEQLDRPTLQVLIEAHIVETSNDTARALGVQWGGLVRGTSDGGNKVANLGADSVQFNDDFLKDPETGDEVEFLWPINNVANFPITLEDGIGLSFGMMFQNIGSGLLSFQLQALQEEGKLNILSSPSITTLENQIALIESGSRIPIQTVENGEVNIEYVQAVLRLEVTPHVINKDTLKLKIITNKDEPDFTRQVAGNPTILTKRAETMVVLFNGQTTVIGGLSKETNTDIRQGIPKLKDIPGLGWLFGSKSKSNLMEDVLIFITPYILEERLANQPAPGGAAEDPQSAAPLP